MIRWFYIHHTKCSRNWFLFVEAHLGFSSRKLLDRDSARASSARASSPVNDLSLTSVCDSEGSRTSAGPFGFGEGAQLLGVGVPKLLQLPLASPEQVLDVHHVRLLDAGVLPELVTDPWDEAGLVLSGSQKLSVQNQDLLLQLAVPHRG